MKSWLAGTFLIGALWLQACSAPSRIVEHPKEASFFAAHQNPAADFEKASQQINEIKLLQSDDYYSIRVALYDHGRFYYEVDRLGSGSGDWVYEQGALKLVAERKVFDLILFITAAQAQGEDLRIKFIDRFGFNDLPLQVRNPSGAAPAANHPQSLRVFQESRPDL